MKQGLRTPDNGGASEGEIRNFVLLLVEDDDGDADLVRELLDHIDQVSYEVVHVRTLREALVALPLRQIDVVLLDLRLEDAEGLEAVRQVRAAAEDVPIVVLTGADDDSMAFDCLEAGAQDYLLKAEIRGLTLRRSIHYAISRLRERRLREFLNLRVNHIVASSPATLYSSLIDEGRLRHEWVSPNVERLTGYRPEEIAEEGWWREHIHPEDRALVMRRAALLFSEGALKREYRVRRRDGSYLWISDEQRLLYDAEGKPFQAVGSWTDISERHAAEALLEESEERYRLLFEDNPHPMWVYDPYSMIFLEVNDAALRLFGYSREEMLAMKVDALCPATDKLSAETAPDQGRPRSRHQARRKDGSPAEIETATQVIRHRGEPARLVVATDVSDQRRLELQLLQSQKMEAVGQLAGGVAHDFNNLLGVIAGYCELLGNDIQDGRARHRLDEITEATERAAALTRQLLAFGRKQVLQPKIFELDKVVQEIAQLLRRLIGENIEIVTRSTAVLGRVYADLGQLEQVIVNLALNARDAMPSGGRLILETRETYLDEAYARERPGVRPGPHILLLVADNGSGMEPATLGQIFEPFFTTKEPGKGTGLGLSMVYGIIQQSGGHISVHSEPGRGTTFRIYLPKVDGEPETDQPVRDSTPGPPAKGGNETILLLEDSEPLRLILREMLEDAGYNVLDGATLEEAMAFSVYPGPIHLVLSDVVMPGASGPEVVAFLRTQRPGIRAVFMSGYPDEAIGKHGVLDRAIHFLQKPFSSQVLRNKLRDVLDSHG